MYMEKYFFFYQPSDFLDQSRDRLRRSSPNWSIMCGVQR